MGLKVNWKSRQVTITDWTLDDKYLEVYEAHWSKNGQSLTEAEIEALTSDAYLEIHNQATIDQVSARFDRAKDFRKYGP